MNYTELLTNIFQELQIISTFLQLFIYGVIVLIVIYLGYWFFSRFFY